MRKLAIFSFSFSAAVLLCAYLLPQSLWLPGACVGGGALLPFCLLFKGRRRLALAIACSGLALGFLWTAVYDALFFAPARALDDQTIRLSAVVEDYPRPRDYGWQVPVRMKTEQGTTLKVLLYTDEQGEHLRPGDRIESVTHCTLGTRSSAGEEITYYTAKGIFLWGRCYGTLSVDRPEHIPLRYRPAHLAFLLKGSIGAVFPSESAGIVRAVVTGSRDKLTDEFTSSLERTGLSHTVAVSGMHLSCFAGILALLLGRGKKLTALIVIGWSILFCGVAGGTPSISRAAVMIALLHLAPLFDRERDDTTALGFALMVLLAWNPYSAAHVGLQLSFASVAGIFTLSSRLHNWWSERLRLRENFDHPAVRAVWAVLSALCATLGAMAATVPLTALYFGSVSLVAPLSNLLTLWAVTGVFAGGMAVGVLGIFLPELAGVLAVPVSWLARYVDRCSSLCAGFTFSAIPLDSVYYRGWLLLTYAGILWVLLFRHRVRKLLPACCLLLTLGAAIFATARTLDGGAMTVSVLDVGQGQSVVLRMEDTVVLVDCGGDSVDNAGDIAADYLQGRARSRVDCFVLTHYHEDHANGAAQVLRRVEVGRLLLPDVEPDSPIRQELLALAAQRSIPVTFITGDTTVETGAESALIVYPPLDTSDEANEQGLSVLARAGEFEVLITGDMSGETEEHLLAHTALPDIELLISGHHGSKYSTTEALLAAVRPEYCVISVGADNRYGHPAREVLDRLTAVGAQTFRTDGNGTVTITSN